MIPDTTGFHDFFTSSIKKRLPPLLDNLLSFIYSCVCPASLDFAGQRGLADEQVFGIDNAQISRNHIARRHMHNTEKYQSYVGMICNGGSGCGK